MRRSPDFGHIYILAIGQSASRSVSPMRGAMRSAAHRAAAAPQINQQPGGRRTASLGLCIERINS